MFKRIVFLMILLTLAFGISLCHAESWEQVDTNLWIDIDSIQVEPYGLIKAIARKYLQDNIYYSMVLLVDKTEKNTAMNR